MRGYGSILLGLLGRGRGYGSTGSSTTTDLVGEICLTTGIVLPKDLAILDRSTISSVLVNGLNGEIGLGGGTNSRGTLSTTGSGIPIGVMNSENSGIVISQSPSVSTLLMIASNSISVA